MTGTFLDRRAARRTWGMALATVAGLLLGIAMAPSADAAVLCQRKNKVKVRPEICKGKETQIQDLQDVDTGQTARVDKVFQQFRLACVGASQLVETPSTDSLYFDNIACGGACRTHDGDQAACAAAWAISEEGATSCFYFKNLCLPCADCGDRAGACTNTCLASSGTVTCPNDPTRTINAGPARSQACQKIDNQTECEQAFHETRNGSPATCFWNGAVCRGCGPNNENDGDCTNTCRTIGCADTSRTTLRRCSNIGNDPVACADAWHLTGNGGEPASCYFTGSNCRGCGFPNELEGSCDNTCRPAAP